MTAFIALVRKDLTLYFADRRALIMSIVAPILIAAFFGSLFGSGGGKPAHIEIAVTDLDRSAVSTRIVEALRSDGSFTLIAVDEPGATALVKSGKASAAVVLPVGFGAQAGRALFGAGPKPEIVLRYDPSQSMALQVVRGMLAQHVMQNVAASALSGADTVFADLREQALANPTLPEDRRRDLGVMFDSIAKVQGPVAASGPAASAPAANTPAFTMPYATREEEAGTRPEQKYNSYSHAFVGMSVQFVLLMGVDIGIGLLAMRRLGLWKRLRAAPLSRGTLLASRIASAALIALFSMAVVFAVALAAFGVRIDGSVAGFVGVLIAFALMTASFGLLIAAIGRTPEATRGLAILVTLLLVMLGGAWVPSFLFPDWVQKISLLVPTRWAVDGMDAMTWRGLPLTGAALPIAVLLGFTAVFAALALWRFEWDE